MRLQALILSSGTTRSRENSNMTGQKVSSKFGSFSREHISFHFLSHPTHPGIVHGISSALFWAGDQVVFLPDAANGFIILMPNGQSWGTCFSLMTLDPASLWDHIQRVWTAVLPQAMELGKAEVTLPWFCSILERSYRYHFCESSLCFCHASILPTSICFLDQTDLLLFLSS